MHRGSTGEPCKMPLYQEVKKWLMLILDSSQSCTAVLLRLGANRPKRTHAIKISLSGEAAVSEPKVRQVWLQQMVWETVVHVWCLCYTWVWWERRGTFPQHYGGVSLLVVMKDTVSFCCVVAVSLCEPMMMTMDDKYLMQNLFCEGRRKQIQDFKKMLNYCYSQSHKLLYFISPAVVTNSLVYNYHL